MNSKVMPGAESAAPRRAVNPVAVEWQVLFDEDPNPQRADAPNRALTPVQSSQVSVRQWALLLCLLLLIGGYGLAESGWLAPPTSPARIVPAPPSADSLAQAARNAILTEHLRIYAGGLDLAVAALQADEMEHLYIETFGRMGLPALFDRQAPDGRFFVIIQESSRPRWDGPGGQIVLPSPTLQATLSSFPQRELLRQSWQVAVGEGAALAVAEEYALPYRWLPFLGGLRLWLLWERGGPLTIGKKRIVAWLGDPSTHGLILDEVADICRLFALWRLSPLDYAIPVGCDQSGYLLPSPIPLPTTLKGIAPIYPPRDTLSEQFAPNFPVPNNAVAIALALLLDYTTERYGQQSLARLLAALPQHDNWDTLIPAVFDLSAEEFEASWQVWLGEVYGIRQ